MRLMSAQNNVYQAWKKKALFGPSESMQETIEIFTFLAIFAYKKI